MLLILQISNITLGVARDSLAFPKIFLKQLKIREQ